MSEKNLGLGRLDILICVKSKNVKLELGKVTITAD